MLCVLRANRGAGLLRRLANYQVWQTTKKYYSPVLTKRTYSQASPPPSNTTTLKWDVDSPSHDTSVNSSSASPSSSDQDDMWAPFTPHEDGAYFGIGFPDYKEGENLFFSAICTGENAKVLDGIEKYGVSIKDHFGSSPLHWAVLHNQVEVARTLISLGADVNAANLQGCTPLFGTRGLECVKLLVEQGASTRVTDVSGHTALHYAAAMAPPEILEALVKACRMDVNAVSRTHYTPLHSAAASSPSNVSTLVALGAKVDIKDLGGRTPLHIIANIGGLGVKELVKVGSNVEALDNRGETPLLCAARFGRVHAIRDLCESGANVDFAGKGFSPLTRAAVLGFIECMEVLLKYGAKIDQRNTANGATALTAAISSGISRNHVDTVRFLLHKGANKEVQLDNLNTPLSLAIQAESDSIELIRLLVEAGANLNGTEAARPYHIAAMAGNIETMEELRRLGAKVDAESKLFGGGSTALFAAAYFGHLDATRWLIERGVDVNHKNSRQQTVIGIAKPECMELLVKAGVSQAKLDIFDDIGYAPVHIATFHSEITKLEKLVTLGADINLSSPAHRAGSPLHVAASRVEKPKEVIQALLRLGAKLEQTSAHVPPLCVANTAEAAETLIDAGAEVNGSYAPLVFAVLNKHEGTVRTLLNRGADVSAVQYGKFPLFLSVAHPPILDLLLEHGADVNQKTEAGEYALHSGAMIAKDATILSKLVPKDGVDVKTSTGRTPLYLAAESQQPHNVLKLIEMGANVDLAMTIAQQNGKSQVVEDLKMWKENFVAK